MKRISQEQDFGKNLTSDGWEDTERQEKRSRVLRKSRGPDQGGGDTRENLQDSDPRC